MQNRPRGQPWIDAENGILYGKYGRPIRKRIKGYVYWSEITPEGVVYHPVHRLIWESVHGPIPAGLQINHKNGVKHDNRIDNMEVVTQSENTQHAYATGLLVPYERIPGRLYGAAVVKQRNTDAPSR